MMVHTEYFSSFVALPQSAARSNSMAEIVSAGTNIGGETTRYDDVHY